MRTKEQRDRQKAQRERSKQRRKARKAKQFEQQQSARIQTVRAIEQRGVLHLRRNLNTLSSGTLQRDKRGRMLSTTTGSVQGPVPVRASI